MSAPVQSQSSAAAARLEASDDALMCIFKPLSLIERLRLVLVSKRWLRLLLADVRVPRDHARRMPAIVRWVGTALRSLRLEELRGAPDSEFVLAEILKALLPEGVGEQLRTLIMWQPADADDLERPTCCPAGFAKLLGAACPRLDASTRMAVVAKSAAEAVEMLDAVPGRHHLRLLQSRGGEQSLEDLRQQLVALLRHPRLSAFTIIELNTFAPGADADDWFHAVVAAVGDAVQRRGADGCPLEHVYVGMNPFYEGRDGGELLNASTVAAAFEGAATGRLQSLQLSYGISPENARSLLTASRGSLRHLSINAGHVLADASHGGAAALAALLGRVGGDLESLELKDSIGVADDPDPSPLQSLSAGLAPLLSSADCRVRALALVGNNPAADPFNVEPPDAHPDSAPFFAAVAANRSLKRIGIASSALWPRGVERLAAALAARATPLQALVLTGEALGPSGAPRLYLPRMAVCRGQRIGKQKHLSRHHD